MNEADLPPQPASEPTVRPPQSRRPILIGFATGLGLWLLPVGAGLFRFRESDSVALITLIGASLFLPPVSVVLAIIPRTRRIGLGLLLACGLGWLVLGSMCGGMYRHH